MPGWDTWDLVPYADGDSDVLLGPKQQQVYDTENLFYSRLACGLSLNASIDFPICDQCKVQMICFRGFDAKVHNSIRVKELR